MKKSVQIGLHTNSRTGAFLETTITLGCAIEDLYATLNLIQLTFFTASLRRILRGIGTSYVVSNQTTTAVSGALPELCTSRAALPALCAPSVQGHEVSNISVVL